MPTLRRPTGWADESLIVEGMVVAVVSNPRLTGRWLGPNGPTFCRPAGLGFSARECRRGVGDAVECPAPRLVAAGVDGWWSCDSDTP
jgi:hypothetical protein